jgi:hypothetical protein
MAHFLYKAHVYGPENNVTSPDILIDKAWVTVGSGGTAHVSSITVDKLSSRVESEVNAGEFSITPAYFLIAAGGGVLLSVGAQVYGPVDGEASSTLLVGRYAWRLRNVIEHVGSLELTILKGPVANAHPLGKISVNELPDPQAVVGCVGYDAEALPRGAMVCCPAPQLTQRIMAPGTVEIRLDDEKLGRKLTHRADCISVEYDPWEHRPLPRYTVGPVGDVKHYI